MSITSETFYRAECDAKGCEETLPNEDHEGASHMPREYVVEALAEPRGFNDDETWTMVGEQTFCHRHKPGNVECSACEGVGFLRAEREGDRAPGTSRYSFTECPVCEQRGYLIGSIAETGGQSNG
ncbi:hypothetical protein N8K70_03860 [Microbacterium betulae]|uniref:Uncharacterized protein n=1 Tax=Microbacterium betulae TaxID=2981139 RepID=A0AA97FHS8_9MICO|nr:hypothetical protein [Microbacterium sp. AB]WOF23826.1 hypothetical protein N8K70_03860 [Microbacterium sp. AB]